jgi:hypothetical protein
MTNQHPITPPPELVQQWKTKYYGCNKTFSELVTEVAQYGADQELEACCEWLHWQNLATHSELIPSLRAARRPKPPSLKEQALTRTAAILNDPNRALLVEVRETLELALRALEQLDD